LTNRYLHGAAIDQVLADEQFSPTGANELPGTPGEIIWPLADHLGTIRDLATYDNDITTVANHRVFGSFGNLISETNDAIDHLFAYTGRELDEETGMNYHRNRYTDPLTGGFISEDPIGFAGDMSNLVRYVGNAATVATDPVGEEGKMVIYLNDSNVPRKSKYWTKDQIQTNLRTMFPGVSITVIETTLPSTSYTLGFTYDQDTFADLFDQSDLSPALRGLNYINPVTACVMVGDGLGTMYAREVTFYTGYVRVDNATQAGIVASTGVYSTKINAGNIFTTFGKANSSMVYSNIIAHEQFWLGLLGESDDPNAVHGTLPSGIGAGYARALMNITADELQSVKDALDIP